TDINTTFVKDKQQHFNIASVVTRANTSAGNVNPASSTHELSGQQHQQQKLEHQEHQECAEPGGAATRLDPTYVNRTFEGAHPIHSINIRVDKYPGPSEEDECIQHGIRENNLTYCLDPRSNLQPTDIHFTPDVVIWRLATQHNLFTIDRHVPVDFALLLASSVIHPVQDCFPTGSGITLAPGLFLCLSLNLPIPQCLHHKHDH
ncbi:hypothetical protein BGZ52_010738, partial [Haplosporangium bisporale]